MLARLCLLAVLLLGSAPGHAQIALTGAGTGGTVISGGSTYTGPGDVVSGATAFYGLRAYNAAYATGSNNALNVRRASDNSTSNIVILANGNLDIATANTFAGVDATGTGAISGTTLTFTGGHVGDTVTGGTTAAGTYIVSGSSPTWTVNISQTVVSTTLTLQFGLFVTTLYDQTGNGHDAVQATAGNQPQLIPNALNSGTLPGINFIGTTSLVGTLAAANQPWSFYAVASQNPALGGVGEVMATSGTFEPRMILGGSTTLFQIYAGSGPVTASSSAANITLHTLAATFQNTTSFGVLDGTASGNLAAGTDTLTNRGTNIVLGSGSTNGTLSGFGGEFAVYPIGFNSTQYGNLHTNPSAFWGTP